VKVPREASGTAAFEAKLSWIVCEDACVAEKAEVAIAIPVAADAKPGTDSAKFAATRTHLPKNLPPSATVTLGNEGAVVEFPGAMALAFFPGPACTTPTDPLGEGEAKGSRLKMGLQSPKEGDTTRFEGVLEVRAGAGTSLAYCHVDVSKPGSAPARK
jgi:DsbC/DsbD-like thiol-disulfide interchange protein